MRMSLSSGLESGEQKTLREMVGGVELLSKEKNSKVDPLHKML